MMLEPRRPRRRARGALLAIVALVILGLSSTLPAMAADRARIVRDGPSVPPTAAYRLDPDSTSLLAAGSDPRLRVQAIGQLETADTIVVLVPGLGHDAAEFDTAADDAGATQPPGGSLPQRAANLYAAMRQTDPAANIAVVAWLGYVPPTGFAAGITSKAMETGAANLAVFAEFLAGLSPSARVSWLCHSYGSLVCASALTATSGGAGEPAALAAVGTPGLEVNSVAELETDVPIYVAVADADLIRLASLTNLVGGGFGADPTAPAFGARAIPCDPGAGHSDYFEPGSLQLRALADVAVGVAA